MEFNNRNIVRREKKLLKKITRIICFILILLILGFTGYILLSQYREKTSTVKEMKAAWEKYEYQHIYELGKTYLQQNPYNNTVLIYYSYSCFYLAQAQTDTSLAQNYLDECIINLRLALYEANKSVVPQIQYMLGRAYFYKNTITTNYYADLAVKYLYLAKQNGYEAQDIPEYLGLSYAALGMTMESISAFTEALLIRESDALLLSIAEQYYKAKEFGASEQYLFRIINNSQNDEMIIKSQILLGNIYIDKEDFEHALKEFENVLKKNENSADAHYGIGVVYEKQGNLVKARSEWRKTLKIQVNHPGALQKMNEN